MNDCLDQKAIAHLVIEKGILETKTDCSGKDQLFYACVAFWVITFEPIMIQTCSAPQNDRLKFSFVKDIKVFVQKMTRNRHKMIGKTADSLFCPFHGIQFSPLVFLPLWHQIAKHAGLLFCFTYCCNQDNFQQFLQPILVFYKEIK